MKYYSIYERAKEYFESMRGKYGAKVGIIDAGRIVCSTNGQYKIFSASDRELKVHISIEKT